MAGSWLGAAIGGGISLSMGFGEGIYNAWSSKKAFRRQKMLMKNAFRWRVQDMINAGVNPMAMFGGGANVPMPTVQQGHDVDLGGVAEAAERGFALASARELQRAETAEKEAGAELAAGLASKAEVDTRKSVQETVESARRADLMVAQVDAELARASESRASSALKLSQLPVVAAERKRLESEAARTDVERRRREQGMFGKFFRLQSGEMIKERFGPPWRSSAREAIEPEKPPAGNPWKGGTGPRRLR